jgi:putative PEP-CTERM system TPR-repeat lipoprotein
MSIQTQTVSALTAALLALAVAGCGASPEESMRQAQGYMDKADYKAAVLELKNVLQAQPENGQARFLLGKAHLARGAYVDAEKELSRARELGANDPELLPMLAKSWHKLGQAEPVLALELPENGLNPQAHASVLALRAEILFSQGKRAEAEQSLSKARTLASDNPDLLLVEARRAVADGEFSRAGEYVDGVLKADAKSLDALFLKAELAERDNRDEEAAAIFKEILANDPQQFLPHLALSQQAIRRNDLDAADKHIQAAEKAAPKSQAVRYARGIFELRRERYKEAVAALQQVLSTSPDHLPSILAMAAANHGLGNFEQSILGARRVLAHRPDNSMAKQVLAGSLVKTGDAKGALDLLLPLLKGRENDVRLLAQIGTAYLESRDFGKAMDYLDRAATLDPNNPEIRSQQATGHLARGETERALIELEQASRLSASAGQADLALIVLNLRHKDYDAALQAIAALEKKAPNTPVTHNLRAAALLGQQDRAGARKALQRALEIDPTFHPAAVNLARLDMQDKNPDAARKTFENVLAKDKNNLAAMLALADLASAGNREKDYLDWLERAAKAHPAAIPPRAALVRHYLGKQEPQKAMAAAKAATNANPDNAEALILLGTTQLAVSDNAGAVATMTRLVDKHRQSPDAHHHLALALGAQGKTADARASLKQALKLKSDHQPSLNTLIRLELSENNTDAALQLARDMQRLNARLPFGFAWEGDIHMARKQPERAVKPYQLALDNGGGGQTFIKLHVALGQSGDSRNAQARLDAWLKSHPDDLVVLGYAAAHAMRQGQDKLAASRYEDILRKNPGDAVAMNNLANLYQRQKDPRALDMAEKALKLKPGNAVVLDTLGWILLEQGQLAKGLPHLAQAAGQAEKHPVIQYHYAVALARSGDKAKAREALRKALAVTSDFPEKQAARELLRTLE